MMEPPKRAWILKIEVGGDTLEDAVDELRYFTESIERGSRSLVSGGYSRCGFMSTEHNPAMTQERYQESLAAYIASTKDGEQAAGQGEGGEGGVSGGV